MTPDSEPALDVDRAVRERYSEGARARQADLCCPSPQDPAQAGRFEHVPSEVIEKDYGCGDPSRFIREGDTVVDLGSGAGRICYIAAGIVGSKGQVIGVDMNDDMLAVARRHQEDVASRLGYRNVAFRKGRIQDLQLDYGLVEEELERRPLGAVADLARFEAFCRRARQRTPLIESDSVDLVVSNCVLNLVPDADKPTLFREIYRVLRRGGRVAISDIVCDDEPTAKMKADPELWSGCLSGAYREDRFLMAFEEAGFHAVTLEERSEAPWRVVGGMEFRPVTVTARKGKEGPCLERRQAVIYRGPWAEVLDDDGHRLRRGERTAVCDKTFKILTGEPYDGQVIGISPLVEVPLDQAPPFLCNGASRRRDPAETRLGSEEPTGGDPACDPDSGCC